MLEPYVVNRGINTWDAQHCDVLLSHASAGDEALIVEQELYCTMGDVWVITVQDDGWVALRQMTHEQAVAQIKARITRDGWRIPSLAQPTPACIRLFKIKKGWLSNDR